MARKSPRTWSTARKPILEDDLGVLLGDLCVLWGFCNGLTGQQLLRERAVLTDDDFAIAVLAAEGFEPFQGSEWRNEIARRFREHYGRSVTKTDYERDISICTDDKK